MNKKIDANMKPDISNLKIGDIVTAPDKILDGEKNKRHLYKIVKFYSHFFIAERLDRHFVRSFVNADYITGLVKLADGEDIQEKK